jgi:lysophospholipase L1-like esterase
MGRVMTNHNAVDNSGQNVKPNQTVIACLGSSSTSGKGQAFDWISELRRKHRNKHYDFRNFGVGGDLSYNALRRLPAVIECRPGFVIVWIGANDVLALVSGKVRRIFRIWKHLPAEPSREWFLENISIIVRRLKGETSARIALCSLAPLGEDLSSAHPFQSALNQRIEEFSATIKDVAIRENVGYIPLYEAMSEQIRISSIHAFTSFRFLPFYRDAFRIAVMRKSPDDVARMNGWSFHTDGVHVNSRAGKILAALVQELIDDLYCSKGSGANIWKFPTGMNS